MIRMQAVQIHGYGGPEVVAPNQRPKPTPAAHEVLLRVPAAGVNPIDVGTRNGFFTTFFGFDPPLPYTLGWEVSGVIEAVGDHVQGWEVGDAVYAVPNLAGGGFAPYIALAPDVVARKPQHVDHQHAAGVPVAGLAAWQALHDYGAVQAGQHVLVLAASGGVGTFAVHFACFAGVEVWSTTSTGNLDFVRSLGAAPIDYTARPFEETVPDKDLVIDTLAGESQLHAWRTLKPNEALVSVVTPPSDPDGSRRGALVVVQQRMQKTMQLTEIGQVLASGAVQAVIDEILPCRTVRQALEKSVGGHARGNIILGFEEA